MHIRSTGSSLHFIWVPSSEFVSSSIPSWQILTAHAQPFRGARDLAFCLKVPLDSLLVWASSEDSGETARMRRLAWTFAARTGDKYQIRLTRSIYHFLGLVIDYFLPPAILMTLQEIQNITHDFSVDNGDFVTCTYQFHKSIILCFYLSLMNRVKAGTLV